jgi:hypothetical protein
MVLLKNSTKLLNKNYTSSTQCFPESRKGKNNSSLFYKTGERKKGGKENYRPIFLISRYIHS